MLVLAVRVVLSLAVVLGLFWMVARTGSRKMGGRDRALVKVRSRQSLSRGSSLAVVEVGSRVLVVGVSDSGVRLLTELAPHELSGSAAPLPVAPLPVAPAPAVPTASDLSPAPGTGLVPSSPPHGLTDPVTPGYPDYADHFSARFVPDDAYGPDYAAAYAPDVPPDVDPGRRAGRGPPRHPARPGSRGGRLPARHRGVAGRLELRHRPRPPRR